MTKCYFCNYYKTKRPNIYLEDDRFYAVFDPAPVSKGHCQIIPKQHVDDLFELKPEDIIELYKFIVRAKKILDKKYSPEGYNIGVNCGPAAGQSIMHLHIHIIPRYAGDIKDPKGGVRNLFGKYTPPEAPAEGFH